VELRARTLPGSQPPTYYFYVTRTLSLPLRQCQAVFENKSSVLIFLLVFSVFCGEKRTLHRCENRPFYGLIFLNFASQTYYSRGIWPGPRNGVDPRSEHSLGRGRRRTSCRVGVLRGRLQNAPRAAKFFPRLGLMSDFRQLAGASRLFLKAMRVSRIGVAEPDPAAPSCGWPATSDFPARGTLTARYPLFPGTFPDFSGHRRNLTGLLPAGGFASRGLLSEASGSTPGRG
jgi:hypothetical protein